MLVKTVGLSNIIVVDFHLFLEDPPQDQTERWCGRPFRALSIVLPPSSVGFDPVRLQADKHRFLEKLWTAQAMYRARHGRSVVLYSSEREMEARGGKITLARTYFNVYQRTAYLGEPKKVNQVVSKSFLPTILMSGSPRLSFTSIPLGLQTLCHSVSVDPLM